MTGSSYAPDRYKMCAACPQRHQADLFEELGSMARAAAIRDAGCGWWQEGIPSVDPERGFMAQPTYTGCFRPYLPSYLITIWHAAGHNVAAYNDARNVVLKALSGGGENGNPLAGALVSLGIAAAAGGSRHAVPAARITEAAEGSDHTDREGSA